MKRRTRKGIALLVVLVMLATFAGCGETGSNGSDSNNDKSSDPVVFIVGTETAETSNTAKALKEMEKQIEENSDGAVDVQLNFSGVLGSEAEMIEQTLMGSVQMVMPSSSLFVSYDAKFGIFDIPFLFSSNEAVEKAYAGELGEMYNGWMDDLGFECFGIIPTGFRGLSNDKRAVHSPSDVKGLKIRVMESDTYIKTFELLGANVITMNYSDVYGALQQGVIDGQDNPPEFTVSSGFYELNRYYTRLNHVMSVMPVVGSKTYMDSLDPDIRNVIMEGIGQMIENLTQSFKDSDAGYVQTMVDAGVEVTELTDEEMAVFRDKIAPMHDEYREKAGQ